MSQSERVAGGLTAEIGTGLGFGYQAGPPRTFSFGFLRITLHGGLVIYLGRWRLALEDSRKRLGDDAATNARLRAALESERAAHDETLVSVADYASKLSELAEETLASRGE